MNTATSLKEYLEFIPTRGHKGLSSSPAINFNSTGFSLSAALVRDLGESLAQFRHAFVLASASRICLRLYRTASSGSKKLSISRGADGRVAYSSLHSKTMISALQRYGFRLRFSIPATAQMQVLEGVEFIEISGEVKSQSRPRQSVLK